MTSIFFDTFFNLEKYLDHEQRDPFASARDHDAEGHEVGINFLFYQILFLGVPSFFYLRFIFMSAVRLGSFCGRRVWTFGSRRKWKRSKWPIVSFRLSNTLAFWHLYHHPHLQDILFALFSLLTLKKILFFIVLIFIYRTLHIIFIHYTLDHLANLHFSKLYNFVIIIK